MLSLRGCSETSQKRTVCCKRDNTVSENVGQFCQRLIESSKAWGAKRRQIVIRNPFWAISLDIKNACNILPWHMLPKYLKKDKMALSILCAGLKLSKRSDSDNQGVSLTMIADVLTCTRILRLPDFLMEVDLMAYAADFSLTVQARRLNKERLRFGAPV